MKWETINMVLNITANLLSISISLSLIYHIRMALKDRIKDVFKGH